VSGSQIIADERIIRKIVLLRGEKVILDFHLAELYGVETRVLKQAVRRNSERFPVDFMFELNDVEVDEVVSQNVIPSKGQFGGATPFAFTEAGVAMLSGVLRSERAIQMNIAIIRTFIALRKLAANYQELYDKLEKLEAQHDEKFSEIYKALNHLLSPSTAPRRRIGYRSDDPDDNN